MVVSSAQKCVKQYAKINMDSGCAQVSSCFFKPKNIGNHLSNVENPVVDIPLNPGWLIGILIMAYYNPHIVG